MDPHNQANGYDKFLQRLKAYFTRSRMVCSEEKIGGTTVIYVSRCTSQVILPLKGGKEKGGRDMGCPL